MLLQEKSQQCQLLREKIDQLLQTEIYAIEDISDFCQPLYALLNQPIQQDDDAEQYAAFLQLNLDWLQAKMAKLSDDKNALAASMIKIQQGRRARQSYGQHN